MIAPHAEPRPPSIRSKAWLSPTFNSPRNIRVRMVKYPTVTPIDRIAGTTDLVWIIRLRASARSLAAILSKSI
ncbi:hypothetical protein D3C86_1816010 [compost metagenome]